MCGCAQHLNPCSRLLILYEKSLVVTFIRKVGKRKYSASGEEVDSIFFQVEWALSALIRASSVYDVDELVLEFLQSPPLLAELNQEACYGYE